MSKYSIDEHKIKAVLRRREQMLANIHKKMFLMYEEMAADKTLQAAFPASALDGMPKAIGEHKDIGDVLERRSRIQHKGYEEIREFMWALTEQEEMINRIWICFCALEDPYYTILDALYVKNQLYDTVEKDFGMSHKSFEKYRKEGIRLIILFYGSEKTAAELMRGGQSGKRPQKKKDDKGGYEQISFL